MAPAKLVFFGSSPFSNLVLSRLIAAEIPLAAVVTKPDQPAGRHLKLTPNSVKTLALQNGLAVQETFTLVSGQMGLVAAYGKIIPQKVIDGFENHIYNIHPSLLPKYRGPSPLQQQILDGITDTGVTIIRLDAQMDHGPVVAQTTDVIRQGDTAQTLGERLFTRGTEMFIEQVWGKIPLEKEQEHSLASVTKMLTRQDGFIDWAAFSLQIAHPQPGSEIDRKFRAYYPWPGVWTINPESKRVKLVSLYPVVTTVTGT
ncbi:MAG: methionyl-tRNA formyltransferase [bacterium]|nr:methionyl-tRNA formyltransferase [bacterium]